MTNDAECVHDWRLVNDWEGDPNVINGVQSFTFARCRKCGEDSDQSDAMADALDNADAEEAMRNDYMDGERWEIERGDGK